VRRGLIVFACLFVHHDLCARWGRVYTGAMRDHAEATIFHIRATDPRNSEQLVYQCVGFPMAHAKAAELRMSGYRDVVTSVAPHGSEAASQNT
jgi:hypothetical protein